MALKFIEEPLRQTRIAMVRPGQRAGHGSDGVGVVTGVDSGEEGLLEILGTGKEAPEGARE